MSGVEDLLALAEPRFDRRGDSNYDPVAIGLHLCGICSGPDGGDINGEQPYTALNIAASSDAEARAMWEAARLEASVDSRDNEDFLCDLNLSDGHCDDFSTNRQMIPRLIAAALRARSLVSLPSDMEIKHDQSKNYFD